MIEDELATVKLFKFDSQVDTEPRYDAFRGPYRRRSVLDVLRYIYENLDSTFAYRWACTKGRCRGCVVLVNGKPELACMKSAEKYMKIEPHPKFRTIKDLLVDFKEVELTVQH